MADWIKQLTETALERASGATPQWVQGLVMFGWPVIVGVLIGIGVKWISDSSFAAWIFGAVSTLGLYMWFLERLGGSDGTG